MNEQENFWAHEYAREYIRRNAAFDHELGVVCWKIMLAKAAKIATLLECGCNIGRNIGFLDTILPEARKSVIEISAMAFDFVTRQYRLDQSFKGSIVGSDFDVTFDLVFTMGVLIHIHPDELLGNMSKMFDYSHTYILMGEYFSRMPVMQDYRGKKDRLFKRDFGKLFIENFPVRLVDYGFLWGYLYDAAGFDDGTWWLFEKS